MYKRTDFSELIGKTIKEITGAETDSGEIRIELNTGEKFRFFHYQGCCESVYVESIVGDVSDLIGEPLLLAEEVAYENEDPAGVIATDSDYRDSFTWTFYKFATRKGYVDIRWYGTSNGYYSESVDFERIKA